MTTTDDEDPNKSAKYVHNMFTAFLVDEVVDGAGAQVKVSHLLDGEVRRYYDKVPEAIILSCPAQKSKLKILE
jgi:hypothetical protein